MELNQKQNTLALKYHKKAYEVCINTTDYFKARVLYEKTLELNSFDQVALFNLEILKVIT